MTVASLRLAPGLAPAPRAGRTLQLAAIAAIVCTGTAVAGDPACSPVWDTTLGTPGMADGYVASLHVHDFGSGPQLYATGTFTSASGNPGTQRIARWNGSSWVSVGGGLVNQFSNVLTSFNGDLYVGGYFDSAAGVPGTAKLARWNGTQWSSVNAQLESFLSSVWSFEVFDDGTGEALYIGGNYVDIGGTGIDHIARFDGTNFTEVGGTIVGPNQIVLDLTTYDGELYACGRFQTIAGVAASNIARWDGMSWKPVGGGITGVQAVCMTVFDGDLYVGGGFTAAGGVPATRIARWDGSQWHALGTGLNAAVQSLAAYDDGDGPKLYAVGNFTATGDNATSLPRIGRWTGTEWEAVGSGATANIFAATVIDDGTQDVLLVGGSITSINGQPTGRVAAYVGCTQSGPLGDLNGDGVVNGADLGILLSSWGICRGECPADLNGDGVVDGADLGILLSNWG